MRGAAVTSEPRDPGLRPGDLVVLIETADEKSRPEPGTRGRVVRAVPGQIDVEWEDGSSLSMLLDQGDVIDRAYQADVFPGGLWHAAAEVYVNGDWRPADPDDALYAAELLGWHHEYDPRGGTHLVSPHPAQAAAIERKGHAEFHVRTRGRHFRFVVEQP